MHALEDDDVDDGDGHAHKVVGEVVVQRGDAVLYERHHVYSRQRQEKTKSCM